MDRFRQQRYVRRAEFIGRNFYKLGAFATGARKLQEFRDRDFSSGPIPRPGNPGLRGTKRKFDEEDGPKEDSLLNSQSTTNMTDGQGSKNQVGLKETPVDDVYQVHRGPPNYTFASLPYVFQNEFTGNINTADYVFRMTSPYDTGVLSSTTDANIQAGVQCLFGKSAATDADPQQARWFNFYASMYRYYHVVSARWSFTVENMSMDDMYVHQFYCNDEIPSIRATNDDIMLWQGVRSEMLKAVGTAVQNTGLLEKKEVPSGQNIESKIAAADGNFEDGNIVPNQWGTTIINMNGDYQPGDYTREIRLDADVENWTAIDQNPKLPEFVVFRLKTFMDGQSPALGDANNRNRPLSYRFRFKIDYLVEFKELRRGLRYPITRQPAVVTINSNESETTNGAVVPMEEDI